LGVESVQALPAAQGEVTKCVKDSILLNSESELTNP